MRFRTLPLLGLGLLIVPALAPAQEQKEPYYVGARVCATCHEGPEMGHQYSKWLLSKHSRAYSRLSLPQSREIVRLSGVPQEPQESIICLSCHATGMEAEDWERDDTFFIDDGVQCEKCHGPGSEYIDPQVMMNRELAMRRGLRMPTKADCFVCHNEKGTHLAVHDRPMLDLDEAWERIAHRTPESPNWEAVELPAGRAAEGGADPRYMGVHACAECHRDAVMGFQFSRWRESAHSMAYARLSTPEAMKVARDGGVSGDPQKSADCLKCHVTGGADLDASLASFTVDEGVGCEACHGPGSEYQYEAIMRDPIAARAAGLRSGGLDACLSCHADAHGKPFDYEVAWEAIKHPNNPPRIAEEPRYKTPMNMAITPDSKELYVACEASDSIVVVDIETRRKVAEIPVGGQPHAVTFHPDGLRAFVSNRLDDTVSEIDVRNRQVVRTAPVGDEPHGLVVDPAGRRLFVANTLDESVSVLDTESLEEVKRLAASRNPWAMDLSPDGSTILLTNALSRFVELEDPSVSEITVIETERGVVVDRLEVHAANLLLGVSWHPGGEFAFFTLNRTKNRVTMARIAQGWVITNGLGVAWRDGRVDQVLLDHPDLYFPDPTDVTFTPDGRLAFVTSATSDRVAVVDVEKLIGLLKRSSDYERREVIPNHLGKSREFIVAHIPTKNTPRGMAMTPNGKSLFIGNSLDDSLTVVDVQRLEAVERVDLGGPREITLARKGERLFHSANITFRRQFSCNTCHPDGHVDGLTYDIEPDGVGVNPVDNRTLRGIYDTAPFKWKGTNPSLSRQCGARLSVFFTRIQPFTPEELAAVDRYIGTIKLPPNRYRPLGAELTPAQRRGKHMFERTMTNDGEMIPVENRCITCHPPPYYTNRLRTDVGTRVRFDDHGLFDVPQLNNIYNSAPYLHNGIAPTLEEIWTVYNPDDRHGVTNDMTKDELNDLIEYIKTF
jgi:YVTN family beta-propeller protein